jgi:hypothetical protein
LVFWEKIVKKTIAVGFLILFSSILISLDVNGQSRTKNVAERASIVWNICETKIGQTPTTNEKIFLCARDGMRRAYSDANFPAMDIYDLFLDRWHLNTVRRDAGKISRDEANENHRKNIDSFRATARQRIVELRAGQSRRQRQKNQQSSAMARQCYYHSLTSNGTSYAACMQAIRTGRPLPQAPRPDPSYNCSTTYNGNQSSTNCMPYPR